MKPVEILVVQIGVLLSLMLGNALAQEAGPADADRDQKILQLLLLIDDSWDGTEELIDELRAIEGYEETVCRLLEESIVAGESGAVSACYRVMKDAPNRARYEARLKAPIEWESKNISSYELLNQKTRSEYLEGELYRIRTRFAVLSGGIGFLGAEDEALALKFLECSDSRVRNSLMGWMEEHGRERSLQALERMIADLDAGSVEKRKGLESIKRTIQWRVAEFEIGAVDEELQKLASSLLSGDYGSGKQGREAKKRAILERGYKDTHVWDLVKLARKNKSVAQLEGAWQALEATGVSAEAVKRELRSIFDFEMQRLDTLASWSTYWKKNRISDKALSAREESDIQFDVEFREWIVMAGIHFLGEEMDESAHVLRCLRTESEMVKQVALSWIEKHGTIDSEDLLRELIDANPAAGAGSVAESARRALEAVVARRKKEEILSVLAQKVDHEDPDGAQYLNAEEKKFISDFFEENKELLSSLGRTEAFYHLDLQERQAAERGPDQRYSAYALYQYRLHYGEYSAEEKEQFEKRLIELAGSNDYFRNKAQKTFLNLRAGTDPVAFPSQPSNRIWWIGGLILLALLILIALRKRRSA